jgi:monofunctional biosynthetic peptidoglycan transglycosylase
MRSRYKKLSRNIVTVFFKILTGIIGLTFVIVLGLRWITPPTSSFILQHQISAYLTSEGESEMFHRWVPWSKLSPYMSRAVVAAEDQRFPEHWGFDLKQIKAAVQEWEANGRVRGASTISQQVAKNLFLWPGKSWIRKTLEAYFTVLIEITWPKRRTLEVYLNFAQFGKGVYGVGAASDRFFRRPASELTLYQAALLAAVLPNPNTLKVQAPSKYVQRRVVWIKKQMRHLGHDYLASL